MAVKTECEHTDQHILCPQCDDGDPRLVTNSDTSEWTTVLTARYHGDCPVCRDDVYGQRIKMDPDSGLWGHEGCT